MSNITHISGHIPEPERTIGDMKSGEVGYTVEWAIKDGVLDEGFTLSTKGGTCSVRVTCVKPHKYAVRYEKT